MSLRALRAAPTLLRVGLAEMAAYRAELVIWILTATMPLVMMLVWDRVADGGPVQGYSRDAFARYFLSSLVARQLVAAWVLWEIESGVRTGSIGPALLKPVHPMWGWAADTLAALPFRLLVLAPLLGLILWWRPGALPQLDAAAALAFAASTALGWCVYFGQQALIGCGAFWFTQVSGVWSAWFGLFALASGYLFPPELLPGAFAAAARLSPFYATMGVPTAILSGGLRGPAAWAAIGGQAAWAVAIGAVLALVWRAGVRRLEAVGG
jgi:ABC-2 type transport system permease protein